MCSRTADQGRSVDTLFVREIVDLGFRSVSVIGMGKNTGKTFTFNQLVMEAKQLGLCVALTTIGLDGEERDSLFYHDKPKIMVSPGQIVANARSLILDSGLDYEILATTGIMTPLGEVILARALSAGQTVLAGPGTRHELAFIKNQLEQLGIDLLFVDGAVDRRSLAAPMVTDTTVLAVGAETAWDRPLLLEKLMLQLNVLTLPTWDNWNAPELKVELGTVASEAKIVLLSAQGIEGVVTHEDFFHRPDVLTTQINDRVQTIFIRGMLTDDVLVKVLASGAGATSLTLVVSEPTSVFLGKQGFQRLKSHHAALKVLDAIHISAVTVNPFNSRFGLADPIALLEDVGQAVDPIPTFDLNLGVRYRLKKEGLDAIS